MTTQFSTIDVAETVKALAKEHGTTIPSLVSAIVSDWLGKGFDVASLDLAQAQKRGRKVNVDKLAEKFAALTPEALAQLQNRIAAMTAKG